MIVSVQFDLSDPAQRFDFERLFSRQAGVMTSDAPATYEKTSHDADIEFPPKGEKIVGPSIQVIQLKFKACQDADAIAAKELMKAYLTHFGAKAVKDLDDAGRLALLADLDDFLRARGQQ